MKKKVFFSACIFVIANSVFAYNPPCGSSQFLKIASPTQLSSGNAASGSGIFNALPESIAVNPALTAFEQRIQLDADFSALISSKEGFNAAFQSGILIPGKFANFTGLLDGIFLNSSEMNLGNSLNVLAGMSKEITQRVSVGINLRAGFLFSPDADWNLAADLGALYRLEKLGFFKDFRIAFSFLNLGKPYLASVPGLASSSKSDYFPEIATFKTGVSSLLLDTESFKIGASVNFTFPTFQNAIFDFGFQFGIKDMIFISVAETLDVQELSYGYADCLPSVGVSFKFLFNSKNNNYLKAHEWDKSEFTASLAYQNKYETLNAFSGGLNIKLGQKDTKPPVIELWTE